MSWNGNGLGMEQSRNGVLRMVTERPETRQSIETAVCSSKCSSGTPDTQPDVVHVSQQMFRNEAIVEMSVDAMWEDI